MVEEGYREAQNTFTEIKLPFNVNFNSSYSIFMAPSLVAKKKSHFTTNETLFLLHG